ncbi:nuclease [Oscillatoriales cyanobacterium USR001]|nr:nuclease [Oscillatoriales cyanobacterium USR001]
MIYCLFSIALNLALISCEKIHEIPQGKILKVERVVNGQTIEIAGFANQTPILEQVRLMGIEAPDLKQQPWGQAAQQKLEELIDGKQVLLETDTQDKDQFDRQVAYLWQGEILLNEQLIKEGYALVTTRSPNTKYQQRLANAQEWARIMGRGIWNPENPMRQTPAEFRNQHKKYSNRK